MKNLFCAALSSVCVLAATAAMADPVRINDADEGYSRLSRWEQHLDDRISDGMRRGWLNPRRGWAIQKSLDSIEARVVQSYYLSDNGIDYQTFRQYAVQLRGISAQLGENDWGSRNVYGNGWYDDRGPGPSGWNGGPPQEGYGPPQGNYYREGEYERSCHSGNAAAGTIFGAIAGGLIGGAASHGNGAAIAGGVIVGGALGNVLSRDIDCDDQRYAFDAYGRSMNGDVDRDYDWHHGNNSGTFRTVREYRDGDRICRDFHVVTYRDGQRYERDGTACRGDQGYWETR